MKIDKKNSVGKKIGVIYICDSCGKKSSFRHTKCTICNNDICYNCRTDGTPDSVYSSTWYCSSCFEIKDQYIKEIEKENRKHFVKLKNILEKYTRLSVRKTKGKT